MIPVQHIHPMIVHFPIVFFITLALWDLIALARKHTVTGRTVTGHVSTGLALLAGIFAIAAYFFGGMALDVAESGGFHSEIAEIHEGLGETTAVAFAAWALLRVLLWWRNVKIGGSVGFLVPLVEIAGVALIATTAYYGGQLVFELGVNVEHMTGM